MEGGERNKTRAGKGERERENMLASGGREA